MKPVGQKQTTEEKTRTKRSQAVLVLAAAEKMIHVLQRAWLKADRERRARIQGVLDKAEALEKEVAEVMKGM